MLNLYQCPIWGIKCNICLTFAVFISYGSLEYRTDIIIRDCYLCRIFIKTVSVYLYFGKIQSVAVIIREHPCSVWFWVLLLSSHITYISVDFRCIRYIYFFWFVIFVVRRRIHCHYFLPVFTVRASLQLTAYGKYPVAPIIISSTADICLLFYYDFINIYRSSEVKYKFTARSRCSSWCVSVMGQSSVWRRNLHLFVNIFFSFKKREINICRFSVIKAYKYIFTYFVRKNFGFLSVNSSAAPRFTAANLYFIFIHIRCYRCIGRLIFNIPRKTTKFSSRTSH